MILKKFPKTGAVFITGLMSCIFVSCGDDFAPNTSLNLDGYGGYSSEVGPVRDLGEAAYKGSYLKDCINYTVNPNGFGGIWSELTALFPGNLSVQIPAASSVPMKNLDFNLTTRIQFLETCSSKSATCTGSKDDTKDKCCPDGYLSLEKSWLGKTDENGDFSVTLELSPQKWAFQNTDGTSTKTEVENLYFMDSGNLKLLKFEYEIEFKTTGLGSACEEICKGIDFYGNEDFKNSCGKSCAAGSLILQAPSVDLLAAKTHCPDLSKDIYRFGIFSALYPKITRVKSEDGKSAPFLGAPSDNVEKTSDSSSGN